MTQRYASMYSLQQPLFIQDVRNTEFRLIANGNEDDAAFYMRALGPLYSVSSLYLHHRGQIQPMQNNAQVRRAIQQLIIRDEVALQLPYNDRIESNEPFKNYELHCVLRALINGTIQPDLYNGRALPLQLIEQLMAHIDNVANQFLQYAQLLPQAQQWSAQHPITLYIKALENDAIYHVTTGAHDDNATWYRSFLHCVNDPDCPEPTIVLATLLRENPSNVAVSDTNIISAIERALQTNRRQRRTSRTVQSNPMEERIFVTDIAPTEERNPHFGNPHFYFNI
jgi:hypothetical protein